MSCSLHLIALIRIALAKQQHLLGFAEFAAYETAKINATRHRMSGTIAAIPVYLVESGIHLSVYQSPHEAAAYVIHRNLHVFTAGQIETDCGYRVEGIRGVLIELHVW